MDESRIKLYLLLQINYPVSLEWSPLVFIIRFQVAFSRNLDWSLRQVLNRRRLLTFSRWIIHQFSRLLCNWFPVLLTTALLWIWSPIQFSLPKSLYWFLSLHRCVFLSLFSSLFVKCRVKYINLSNLRLRFDSSHRLIIRSIWNSSRFFFCPQTERLSSYSSLWLLYYFEIHFQSNLSRVPFWHC